jgi:hypothetical protein
MQAHLLAMRARRVLKKGAQSHTEETQRFTEFLSVPLCAISAKLCVPNLDFFSALQGKLWGEE